MEEIPVTDIKKLQNGDDKVFDRVMMCYKKMVVGLCFKYMRDIEEANDMAQEVFVKLYESIGKFRFGSKLSTWIYRIAVNHCMNRMRDIKRRGMIEQASSVYGDGKDSWMEKTVDRVKLPDEMIEIHELQSIVVKELALFPDKERMLFILRDIEGVPCATAGKILKMSSGNVKTSASRIREKLRKNVLKKLGEKR